MKNRAALTNLPRLEQLIQASPFDSVIATSLENFTYCSGLYDPSRRIMPNRLHTVIWPAVGEPTLIVPQYRAGVQFFIKDVRGYDFYVRDSAPQDPRGCALVHRAPLQLLTEVLQEKGVVDKRIGLEMGSFPAGYYETLRDLMPRAEFVDCESLFNEARMIKTPEEIAHLRSAGLVTEQAIQTAFERARPGQSSRDVANTIGRLLVEMGADSVAFVELDVISDGERFSYLHHPTTLQEGHLLRVDAGGYFAGYYSDVARMAVVGKPSVTQRSNYDRLFGVQRKIIAEILKPGVPGSQLFEATSQAFNAAGFETPWGMIVHGLGLYIHERPWIRECETYVLEPGMVLCVEAISHGPGQEMWHVEGLILVTADGTQELTTHSSIDELYVIQ